LRAVFLVFTGCRGMTVSTNSPGGTVFEDQYVELLPARTTMQTFTGGAGGAGGAGGDATALSLALNHPAITQTSTAAAVMGDSGDSATATSVPVALTGGATSDVASAVAGAGGAGGAGGGGAGDVGW
jgi:hypothetical protein